MVDLNEHLLVDLVASLENESRQDGLEWFKQNNRIWNNLQQALNSSKSSLARVRLLNVLNQSIKSKNIIWLCQSDEEVMTKATKTLLNHLNSLSKNQTGMLNLEEEAESISIAFFEICSRLPQLIQQIVEEYLESSMGSQLICTVVFQLFISLAEYQEKQSNLIKNEQKDIVKSAELGVFRDETDELSDLNEILQAYSEWISELAFYVLDSNTQDNKSHATQKQAVSDKKPLLVVGLDLQRLSIDVLNKYAFNDKNTIKSKNQNLITDLRVTAMTESISIQALRDGALTFLGLYLSSLPISKRSTNLVDTVTKLIQDQIPDDIDVLQEIQNLEVLEQSRMEQDQEHLNVSENTNNLTLIDKFLKMCVAANSFAVSVLRGFSFKDESQLTDNQVILLSYIQKFSVIESIREYNAQFFIESLDSVFKSVYQGDGLKQQVSQSKNSLGSGGVIGSSQSIQEQHAKQDEKTKTTEIVQSLIYSIMSYFPKDKYGQNGFEIVINDDGNITTSNGQEDNIEGDNQNEGQYSYNQDKADLNKQSSQVYLTQLLQQLAVTHYEILHQVLLAKFERLIDGSEWNTSNIQSVARALAVTPHLLDPALNKRFCITVIRSYLNLIETRRNRLSKALIINGFFHCGLNFKLFVNSNRNVFETLLMKMIELLYDDLPAMRSMSIYYLGEMCQDYSELLLTENRAKEIFLKEMITSNFKSIYKAEQINLKEKLGFLKRLCELIAKSNADGEHQELMEELFIGLTVDIKQSLKELIPAQLSQMNILNSPMQQLGMLTFKACKIICQYMPKLFQKFCGEVFQDLTHFKISAEEYIVQRLIQQKDTNSNEITKLDDNAQAAILELIQISVEIINECYTPTENNQGQSKRRKQLKVTNESGSLEIEEVPVDEGDNNDKIQQDRLEVQVEKIIVAFLSNASHSVPQKDLTALKLISKKDLRKKGMQNIDKTTIISNDNDNNNNKNLKVIELLKLITQLAGQFIGNANRTLVLEVPQNDDSSCGFQRKYQIDQASNILSVLLEIAQIYPDLLLDKLMEQASVNNNNNSNSYINNPLYSILFEQFSGQSFLPNSSCSSSSSSKNVLLSLKILVLLYEASTKSQLWKTTTSCSVFKDQFIIDTLRSLIPPRFKLSGETLSLAGQILSCISTEIPSKNKEFLEKMTNVLKESSTSAISNQHALNGIVDRQTIQTIIHLSNPKKIEIELMRLRSAVVASP